MDLLNGNKTKRNLEDAGVKIARNRFKNVLKHMVQDSFMHDEESDSDTDENRLYKSGNRTGTGFSTQKPRSKTYNLAEPPKPQATFVMKLFDRGVDLAQFSESTPLFPICRAWIQNKPHNSRARPTGEDESEDSEMDYRDDTEEVYRLPPPEPLPYDEYGNQISVRIPPPLPRTDDELEINYDDESAPSPALLFQNHLDRWNLIRLRWKEASAYNERRYEHSFNILRQIHERNRQEDATAGLRLESVMQEKSDLFL